MAIRTTSHTVTFQSAFVLSGVEGDLPPGEYEIDEDEELMEGLSWLAYRRVATFIRIPAISSPQKPRVQFVVVNHAEFEAALKRDLDTPRKAG